MEENESVTSSDTNNSESELNKSMTDKAFCKLYSEFYGEEVDYIEQITFISFNGKELKEYVEHCIKLHVLNRPLIKFKPTRWEGNKFYCGKEEIGEVQPYESEEGDGFHFQFMCGHYWFPGEAEAKDTLESKWNEFFDAVTE